MAEITLNSFTETLDALIDANPHVRNKGDESVYDRLGDPYFSYSGPTSMGKSFVVQTYIFCVARKSFH